MRLVFMGTPDFAAVSLRALISSRHDIVGVVSQPDRPRGRGMKPAPSPVKALAEEKGLPIYQPEKASDPGFIDIIKGIAPEIIVVVAYGQILKKSLLDLPPYGAINVHASLLPRYRGAAPIQRAIMAGEEVTGVTIMQMDEGMDTGDILSREVVRIESEETAGSLHDKLAAVGARLLLKTLDDIEDGNISRTPQDHALATYAPKITKEEARIEWGEPARRISALVRGLNPVPGAYTFHGGRLLKVWKVRESGGGAPIASEKPVTGFRAGEVIRVDSSDGAYVATGDGILLLEEVQPENGRRLHAAEYARGYHLEPGVVLGSGIDANGGPGLPS